MNHLMIDIETLDTRPSAVVFQVGIVVFNEELIRNYEIFHLDILEQVIAGRTISKDTVKFWKEQNRLAWDRGPGQISSIEGVYRTISDWMGEFGIGNVWSNSPSFDAVILRSLQEDLKVQYPFPSFRTDMDMRTMKNLLASVGRMKDAPKFETSHNALQDCKDQVALVQYMMAQLAEMQVVTPSLT